MPQAVREGPSARSPSPGMCHTWSWHTLPEGLSAMKPGACPAPSWPLWPLHRTGRILAAPQRSCMSSFHTWKAPSGSLWGQALEDLVKRQVGWPKWGAVLVRLRFSSPIGWKAWRSSGKATGLMVTPGPS